MDYLLNRIVPSGGRLSNLVLNLIINGLPSKHWLKLIEDKIKLSFKPYYKWITF